MIGQIITDRKQSGKERGAGLRKVLEEGFKLRTSVAQWCCMMMNCPQGYWPNSIKKNDLLYCCLTDACLNRDERVSLLAHTDKNILLPAVSVPWGVFQKQGYATYLGMVKGK